MARSCCSCSPTPLFVGFANVIMPLQIGSPDVAFPRLNMLGYWLFFFGGLTVALGFFTPGGAAAFGWFAYQPLSNALYSPEVGADLVAARPGDGRPGHDPRRGELRHHHLLHAHARDDHVPDADLHLDGFHHQRPGPAGLPHPGGRPCDGLHRPGVPGRWSSSRRTAAAILWQHLFWFFGHPEVYILALPFFGIASEIIPVFSRKPVFGYKGLVFATMAIGALSMAVWAHHLYVTGAVYLPFFAIMTMLIAVPTG
jgi:cytochrome c oxidase subunit 1